MWPRENDPTDSLALYRWHQVATLTHLIQQSVAKPDSIIPKYGEYSVYTMNTMAGDDAPAGH